MDAVGADDDWGGLGGAGHAADGLCIYSSSEPAHELLPAVHQVASLVKRWLAGTMHDGQADTHLAYYLDEYTFRFNRRKSRSRGMLWFRLVQQAVNTDPHPLDSLKYHRE